MRCPSTLFVVLLSAIAAAVLGGCVGDAASTAHHVSIREGGKGWLVLICIVLSFGAGAVIGALATRWRKKFRTALVAALSADAVIAVLAAGIAFLTVDSPPKIEGHRLSLEFEVRLPASQSLPTDVANTLSVTTAGFVDQYQATLYLSQATQRDGQFVVPGSVPITSHNDQRELMVQMAREAQQDFVLKLPRSPRTQDEAWSEWLGPHYETASLPVLKEREFAVRYRVQRK